MLHDAERQVKGVLFTVANVSAQVRAEGETDAKAAVLKLLEQREAFSAFLRSTKDALVRARRHLAEGRVAEAKVLLHGIDSGARTFDLATTSDAVQEHGTPTCA